jgi:hypothetical protein
MEEENEGKENDLSDLTNEEIQSILKKSLFKHLIKCYISYSIKSVLDNAKRKPK